MYEIISKIQTMRKESGFEVTDHIRVSINGNDKLSEIAQKNKEAISGKVLADELTSRCTADLPGSILCDQGPYRRELDGDPEGI